MEANISIKAGTVTGTILSVLPTILSDDIVRTIILAITGAVVSFSVTLFLKWITKFKKK